MTMVEVCVVAFRSRLISEALKGSRGSRPTNNAILLKDSTQNLGKDLDSQWLAEVFESAFGFEEVLGTGVLLLVDSDKVEEDAVALFE